MSVTLCAVASHGLDISSYINDRMDELIQDLQKAWQQHPPQTEMPEDLDDRYWHYDIHWDDDPPMIVISVSLPIGWQMNIYPKMVEFWEGYSYSALNSWYFPDPKPFGNGELRDELFRLMRFLRCEEVVYLPDNARPISRYLDFDIYENIAYQELKARIVKEFGEPLVYPGGVDFERLKRNTRPLGWWILLKI